MSLFSGLLALSPLQALDRPKSLGRARGWAAAEATARPSHPGQTKDLCPLHKPPQVSLLSEATLGASGFGPLLEFHAIWDPFKTLKTASGITFYLLFVHFKWSLINSFSASKLLSHTVFIHKIFIKMHATYSLTSSSNKYLLSFSSVPVDVMPKRPLCLLLAKPQQET